MNHNISEAVRCAKHSEHYDIMYLAQAVGELLELKPIVLKQGECWPEQIMREWDHWRKAIAHGFTGSAPRDWFESLAEMKLVDTPQRKPLTDEQKVALCKQFPDHLTFNAIHAIEAAHGIKENS